MDDQKIIEALHQLEPTDEQLHKMWMKLSDSQNTKAYRNNRKKHILWKRRSLQLVVPGVILILFTSISYVSLNAAARETVKEAFQNVLGLKQSEQDIIGQAEMIQDKGIEVYAPDILAIDDQYLVFGNLRGLIVYDLISKKVVGTIDTQAIGSIYFDGDKKQTHVIKNKNIITIFNSNKGIPHGKYYEFEIVDHESEAVNLENASDIESDQQQLQKNYIEWSELQSNYLDTFDYFYDKGLNQSLKYNEKECNYMYSHRSYQWMNQNQQEVISYIEVIGKQYYLKSYLVINGTSITAELDLEQEATVSNNDNLNSETISSEITSSDVLPQFKYSGDDLIMESICEYFQHNEPITMDSTALWVPAFVIYKVVEKENETLVFGNFHSYTYLKNGSVLETLSGGEMPACMHLVEKNGKLSVSFVERAGDGSNYAKDIKNFTKGYIDLYDSFMSKSELEQDKARAEYLKMYILDNQLDIKYYKDYGWDPVKIVE